MGVDELEVDEMGIKPRSCANCAHIKAKSEKHIHNMTTIFYSYGCTINDFS